MSVPREEIVDLALRYLSRNEIGDFPVKNDLFCLLMREVRADKILKEEEGWSFAGYGVCSGYTYDEEAKPHGKWLWMHFASLASFPPAAQVLKLQPPHVVKGRFQSADRSNEIRILKVVLDGPQKTVVETAKQDTTPKNENSTAENKIVAFRKKQPS